MTRYVSKLSHLAALGIAAAVLPAAGAAAQTFTSLYSFTFGNDGAYPVSPLVAAGTTLYGTAQYGGANFGGALFSLTPATKKVALAFNPLYGFPAGSTPLAGLLSDAGTLYGTTAYGGLVGTMFSYAPQTNTAQILCRFDATNGGLPEAAPIDVGGTLYGTTSAYGPNNYGTLYAYTPGGGCTTVHGFSGIDGATPKGGLVNANGVLYGTTSNGGANNGGTVYSYNIATGIFTTVYTFTGQGDGGLPQGGLILAGTTLYGFASGYSTSVGLIDGGAVFSISTTSGKEKTLYQFTAGADGGVPLGTPVLKSGMLYGTTWIGGAAGQGTVFAVDKATGVETVLHSFSGSDGSTPAAGLVALGKSLYGTTEIGGANNAGTIFSITP